MRWEEERWVERCVERKIFEGGRTLLYVSGWQHGNRPRKHKSHSHMGQSKN